MYIITYIIFFYSIELIHSYNAFIQLHIHRIVPFKVYTYACTRMSSIQSLIKFSSFVDHITTYIYAMALKCIYIHILCKAF